MLIKQPVKEAVREALDEDRIESGGRSPGATVREETSGRSRESSSKRSRGSSSLRRLLLLAAIAGTAYYAKQRRGMDLDDGLGEQVGMGDTGGVETSAEDPLSSDSGQGGDTTIGDESDEGTTTRQ